MAFQLAGFALNASVADIRRFIQLAAFCLLKILTYLKAFGFEAGTAGLSVREFTGIAQIAVVLTILADDAGVVSSGLFQFDMRADFLGYGSWILF